MENDFFDIGGVAVEDVDGFVEGLAAMDDDGQVQFAGDIEMLDEKTLLVDTDGKIIVKIQAGLTYSNDFFILGDLLQVGD